MKEGLCCLCPCGSIALLIGYFSFWGPRVDLEPFLLREEAFQNSTELLCMLPNYLSRRRCAAWRRCAKYQVSGKSRKCVQYESVDRCYCEGVIKVEWPVGQAEETVLASVDMGWDDRDAASCASLSTSTPLDNVVVSSTGGNWGCRPSGPQCWSEPRLGDFSSCVLRSDGRVMLGSKAGFLERLEAHRTINQEANTQQTWIGAIFLGIGSLAWCGFIVYCCTARFKLWSTQSSDEEEFDEEYYEEEESDVESHERASRC